MTTNYVSAVDQMFALFNVAFSANAPAVVGYMPDIRWQGINEGTTPNAAKYWCRVSQQTVIEEQTALADDNGKKRYTASGLIFVQLFCPIADVEASPKGRLLAVIARNAFRGKTTSGKVWFRNVRINELPNQESAVRFNVVAEYEYDEIS